ncbi:hypothetical protein C6I20_03825 [Aeromicrobium sp. A1-2]|nr:hypothetical protein C6I20_03825 [Aeromicrobium sp. A1-2]
MAGLMLAAGTPLSWKISAHRWSVRELFAMFLLAQAAVHLLSMSSLNGEHGMGGMGVSTAMVSAHLLGGAGLVVSIRWGERVLWSLVDVLALRPMALLLAGAPVLQARAVVAVSVASPRHMTSWHVAPSRAPPGVAARMVTL